MVQGGGCMYTWMNAESMYTNAESMYTYKGTAAGCIVAVSALCMPTIHTYTLSHTCAPPFTYTLSHTYTLSNTAETPECLDLATKTWAAVKRSSKAGPRRTVCVICYDTIITIFIVFVALLLFVVIMLSLFSHTLLNYAKCPSPPLIPSPPYIPPLSFPPSHFPPLISPHAVALCGGDHSPTQGAQVYCHCLFP